MLNEDAAVIERVIKGDEEAYQDLVNRWRRPVLSFLHRQLGNMDDALEAAQETFRTVYEKLDGLKDRQRFVPWLFKIALNHARMKLRRTGSRKLESLDELISNEERPEQHYQSVTGNSVFSPEEQLSRQEMEQVVRQALARLSHKQREIILLKEYSGLKFHEIAQVLDCPVSTIKSRMYLGLESLKQEIVRIITP